MILEFNKNAEYDAVGVGAALMDIIVDVDDSVLSELSLQKGHMHLIDADRSVEILKRIESFNQELVPGGSAANTLAGIANLGGTSSFIGKIGNDEHGLLYKSENVKYGVMCFMSACHDMTGHAITFVTKDRERTFSTYLGASLKLDERDIDETVIKKARLLHVEGYLLDVPNLKEAALKAMQIAKENNVRISIDMADPGVVERNKQLLRDIALNYADVVFFNETEAKVFTDGKEEMDALLEIEKLAPVAVVKIGPRGSLVSAKGERCVIEPYPAKVVNTNGAGDAYAAGFLYGLLHGYSLSDSGKIGSYFSAQIVAIPGARLGDTVNIGNLFSCS